jgi:hypothetical protein
LINTNFYKNPLRSTFQKSIKPKKGEKCQSNLIDDFPRIPFPEAGKAPFAREDTFHPAFEMWM